MVISKKLMGKVSDMSAEATKEISRQLKLLEDHLITVQKNQVEFEKYLVDIVERLDRLEHGEKSQGKNK